jgi:hypothetical protein
MKAAWDGLNLNNYPKQMIQLMKVSCSLLAYIHYYCNALQVTYWHLFLSPSTLSEGFNSKNREDAGPKHHALRWLQCDMITK